MSKYVIKVITEVDDDCFLTEYYKGTDENDDVVLTEDLGEAALFDDEEVCESIIDHLCIVLDYMPRTIEKQKMFHVNPKL
jgi:sulfur transfer complex TusBCD TusB component (DsrH family)